MGSFWAVSALLWLFYRIVRLSLIRERIKASVFVLYTLVGIPFSPLIVLVLTADFLSRCIKFLDYDKR